MMQRFVVWGMLPLLLIAGLTFCGEPEPKRAKEAAQKWWGMITTVEKDRDAKLKVLFKQMREQEEKLRELMKPAQAIVSQGDNHFKEAAEQMEGSEKPFASDPRMLGLLLIQHGGLYATMGEYDKAHEKVQKGWRTLQDYAAKNPRDAWSLIDGAVAAVEILVLIERPAEAADCIDVGLARCERRGQGISLEGTPLPARCLLVRAELDLVTGNYAAARSHAEDALEHLKRLYPRPPSPYSYPVTVESATGLNNLGVVLLQLGEEPRAFELLREAQRIAEKLFPKGHPILAATYRNLAESYLQRGQQIEALNWVGKSVAEYKRLFPENQYKKSHPRLIFALKSLADTLDKAGLHVGAHKLYQEAWDDCGKFYGDSSHANKLDTLLSYGRSLRAARKIDEAAKCFQQALIMAHELYPKSRYRNGHPQLAMCLLDTGGIQVRRRQFSAARESFEQARAIYRRSYPRDHRSLSVISQNLGELALRQSNDRKTARAAFAEAMLHDQGELRRFAWIASEAEAIAFARPLQQSYHGYLALSRDAADARETYQHVWAAKSVITRVLQERRAARRAVAQRARELRDLSARISLLLNDKANPSARTQQLPELMEKEERLRREVEKELPAVRRIAELNRLTPAELAKRLPRRSVFVDFVRYTDFLDAKEAQERYVAFVLAPAASPVQIDLDRAAPIDKAIQQWRKAVAAWNPLKEEEVLRKWQAIGDREAAKLRKLVWDKIAKHFPNGTQRIYLSPDGNLSRVPFAALPGRTTDSILLEEYTFAYVPHGPFLLDRLVHPAAVPNETGRFLALGDVAYESLPPLRGSVEAIHLAERSSRPSIVLSKSRATVRNLCEALPQACFAHLATHAFFKEEALQAEHLQEQEYLREWRFDDGRDARGVGLGKRSPLSYTGLVLAGPTRPTAANPEGANLTGNTIADLSLDGLLLLVLSGCQTGLGEYTAGEGVQGLQRAFHIAGCANVIASLWPVDDAGTRVLMEEFYRQLWEKKQSSLEALRLAQLELYRHPQRVSGVKLSSSPRCPVSLWAAFVHSGTGL